MNFQMIQTLFASAGNIEKIKQDIQAFIKNPENSWEERVWVWENCPEEFMKRHLHYIDYSFTDGEEVTWNYDFYIERHEVVICRDLKGRGRFGSNRNPEEWEAFKKHCIEKGIQSFDVFI